MDQYRVKERQERKREGRHPVLWPGRTSDKETKEGKKPQGSRGEPRPSS